MIDLLHPFRHLISVLSLCAVLALPFGAFAEDEPVAIVNGTPISEADIAAAALELGDSVESMGEAERRKYLVDFLVDMRVIADEARKQGLDQGDAFEARVALLRDRILMQLVLDEATGAITEEDERAFYERAVAEIPKQEEIRARHILVETEEKAKELLAEINGGASFEDLAKEHSTGPSGPNGGDLGFFGTGQMVPEFETAAFALEIGGVSAPVKTQFGWHLIKKEEEREQQPPAFEAIRPQVRTAVERQTQGELVQELRNAATIERMDGKE